MKYIGLCGLHGAGKTYLASRLHELAGWPVLDKRAILQRLFQNGWFRRSADEVWEAWYRSIYERFGSGVMMMKAVECAGMTESIVIVDAVHTPDEWRALQACAPHSVLVGVWTPSAIRELRRDEPPEMDVRRIHFWHQKDTCLMSMTEWAFPGALTSESFERLCQAFISYVSTSS